MSSRRQPIMKVLRQLIAQSPPSNIAPWVKPNKKLRAAISKSTRGRLGMNAQEAQRSIFDQHMQKVLRSLRGE